MIKENKKTSDNQEINDDVEKLYDQLNLISEKKETQLRKKCQDLFKTRYIIYSIIFTGIFFFFIMLYFNVLYLIIVIEFITTTIFIIYAFSLEVKYKNIRLILHSGFSNFDYEKVRRSILKTYQVLLILGLMFVIFIILVISLMGINPILLLVITVISLIYIYFDQDNKKSKFK